MMFNQNIAAALNTAKLAMTYNWTQSVASSNPTGGALVV